MAILATIYAYERLSNKMASMDWLICFKGGDSSFYFLFTLPSNHSQRGQRPNAFPFTLGSCLYLSWAIPCYNIQTSNDLMLNIICNMAFKKTTRVLTYLLMVTLLGDGFLTCSKYLPWWLELSFGHFQYFILVWPFLATASRVVSCHANKTEGLLHWCSLKPEMLSL